MENPSPGGPGPGSGNGGGDGNYSSTNIDQMNLLVASLLFMKGCNVLSQSLANPQPLLATHDGTAQDGHATEFTRRFRSRSRSPKPTSPSPSSSFSCSTYSPFVLTFAGLAKKQESRWSDSANDAPDEICECIAESLPSNKTLIMRKIARI